MSPSPARIIFASTVRRIRPSACRVGESRSETSSAPPVDETSHLCGPWRNMFRSLRRKDTTSQMKIGNRYVPAMEKDTALM